MRRSVRVGIILVFLVAVVGLCARAGADRPVIGFAYTKASAPYVALGESSFAARGIIPAPRLLWDSVADSETSDGALALAATFSARTEVAVVVGPSNSRHALATAPAYSAAGLAQIIPSATSRRLREAGPTTFTLAPDDSVEGEFLARFAALDQVLGASVQGVFIDVVSPARMSAQERAREHEVGSDPCSRRRVFQALGFRQVDVRYEQPVGGPNGGPVTILDLLYCPRQAAGSVPTDLVVGTMRAYWAPWLGAQRAARHADELRTRLENHGIARLMAADADC